MNLKVLLKIARTHLLARIKQSSVAALGVTFGIGTFVILVSFMTGLNNMLDGLILNRTPHIRVYNEINPSVKQPVELYDSFKNKLHFIHSIKPKNIKLSLKNSVQLMSTFRKNPQVKGVTPSLVTRVFYNSGAVQLNGTVSGIDILEEVRLFNFDNYIINGKPEQLANNNNGIILGNGVAQKLGLHVGDNVQLITPTGEIIRLKITGFYQSGIADIDKVQSYVNLKTAQRIMGVGSSYLTDINIKLFDIEKAKSFADEIKKSYGINAIDIKSANAQFETGNKIRNMITYAVSVTLLIVAGFGIYNILNMLIYEKMSDIAILKATGFSGYDVKIIFILQAMLIGLAGGVLGLIMGFSVSELISHLPFTSEALPTIKTFPVNFDPFYYIIGTVFALLTTFFAGYMPARRASKIDPVEIIRGQ